MAKETFLDRYEVLERLGRGGFGQVYKAFDTKMGRVVAIKRIDANPQSAFRALSEARAAAKLDHPNVVTVYELDKENDFYYLTMEFIDGVSLAEVLEIKPQLSLEETLDIAIQIADALEAAHLKNVIHRDIKPENIMITRNGDVKVTDFGIAHLASSNLTKEGDILGTFAYMSPEQARGNRIDERTDIFSLSVMIYQMLTGDVPFSSATPGGIVCKVLNIDPTPIREINPGVPGDLERLIFRSLEKDRENRISSTIDLRHGLEAFREAKIPARKVLRPLYEPTKSAVSRRESPESVRDFVASEKLRIKAFVDRHRAGLQRFLNATFIAFLSWYLLSETTFYPSEIARFVPFAILVITLILPRMGIIAALAVFVLPLANFSIALSIFFLLLIALYGLALLVISPTPSVFIASSPFLSHIGVGLAYPLISGLFWNPIQAFILGTLGGLTAEFVDLFTASEIRYIAAPNTYHLLSKLSGEIYPIGLLKSLIQPFVLNPLLVIQPLLWGGVAALVSILVSRKTLRGDLWRGALSAGALLLGQTILLSYSHRGLASMDRLMQQFFLSLIILVGLIMLIPREIPEKPTREEEKDKTELVVG